MFHVTFKQGAWGRWACSLQFYFIFNIFQIIDSYMLTLLRKSEVSIIFVNKIRKKSLPDNLVFLKIVRKKCEMLIFCFSETCYLKKRMLQVWCLILYLFDKYFLTEINMEHTFLILLVKTLFSVINRLSVSLFYIHSQVPWVKHISTANLLLQHRYCLYKVNDIFSNCLSFLGSDLNWFKSIFNLF